MNEQEIDQLASEAEGEMPMPYNKELVIKVIKTAIEKATAFYHTEILGLQQRIATDAARAVAQSADTKRLAEFVIRCGDHMISGSNIADTPLPTEQEWREILAIADAAMRKDKSNV